MPNTRKGSVIERQELGQFARERREAVIDLGYVERGEVTEADLDKALDLLSMTHPGVAK